MIAFIHRPRFQLALLVAVLLARNTIASRRRLPDVVKRRREYFESITLVTATCKDIAGAWRGFKACERWQRFQKWKRDNNYTCPNCDYFEACLNCNQTGVDPHSLPGQYIRTTPTIEDAPEVAHHTREVMRPCLRQCLKCCDKSVFSFRDRAEIETALVTMMTCPNCNKELLLQKLQRALSDAAGHDEITERPRKQKRKMLRKKIQLIHRLKLKDGLSVDPTTGNVCEMCEGSGTVGAPLCADAVRCIASFLPCKECADVYKDILSDVVAFLSNPEALRTRLVGLSLDPQKIKLDDYLDSYLDAA